MYKIFNQRHPRFRTDQLIISHARNALLSSMQFLPGQVLVGGGQAYTWGPWQQYWMRDVISLDLPCHWFAELLGQDYVIYAGLNEDNQSWWVERLVEDGLIPERYLNSLVLFTGEDYSIDALEDRLVDHLCDKLLSALVSKYGMDPIKDFVYIDDCLVDGWESQWKETGGRFAIKPGTFYDPSKIRHRISYFTKRSTIKGRYR